MFVIFARRGFTSLETPLPIFGIVAGKLSVSRPDGGVADEGCAAVLGCSGRSRGGKALSK